MKKSRDVALIIMFAVLNLVIMILIGQIPELATGIPAIGYALIIFHAITLSVAYLMYEGRRWRILTQSLLFNSIALLMVRVWTPVAALVSILNASIIDVGFNSLYGFFKIKNKLIWLVILSQVYNYATHPVWTLLFSSLLLFPFEAVWQNWFIPVISVLLPVMIIEAIAGGYIGYKIYRRVEKLA